MSFRTHVLGVPLDVLSTAELRERTFLLLSSQKAHQAVTANALLLLDVQQNPALQQVCAKASLMLPESAGIRWALRRKNIKATSIAGIDFAWQLCQLCAENGWPVFLFGGSADVLNDAVERLKYEIPHLQIAGTRHGFYKPEEEPEILNAIHEARPRLTLVALGMPKQDLWIAKNLPHLPPGLFMGVGGSFDVWAGRLKRAPRWAQVIGAEWFYRFCQEPWRWPRMLSLPRFVWKVCREKGSKL